MSMIYLPMPYTINLEETVPVTQINTLFVQGDDSAHKFILNIHKGGELVDLSGVSVKCKFTSFGQSKTVKFDGDVEDGKAVAVLKKDCYTLAGRFALTISLVTNNECTVFYGDGYMRTIDGEAVITGNYIVYDLNTLISKINEIDDAILRSNASTESAETASSNAETAAGNANAAAKSAQAATEAANTAAEAIEGMTATATALDTGAAATAQVSKVGGHYQIALGLPRGLTGATPQLTFNVETGAPGTDATVAPMEDSTPEAPHYLLTIPRGDTGEIGNLTVNGIAPGADGSVTVGIDDIDGLRSALDNAGGIKTVAGVAPDAAGDVALTPESVGGIGMELLWQNGSPASNFEARTVSLDLSAYELVAVSAVYTTSLQQGNLYFCRVLDTGMITFANTVNLYRSFAVNQDGIVFGIGLKAGSYNTSTPQEDSRFCIPTAIYGIKGVMSSEA